MGDSPMESETQQQLQAQRGQVQQGSPHARLRVPAQDPRQRLAADRSRLALLRQIQDALSLERIEEALAGRHAVLAAGRPPAWMVANRLRQIPSARGPERRHGLLDVGDLAVREAPTGKRVVNLRFLMREPTVPGSL